MGGTALLGDIGGTNARFALSRNGRIDPQTRITLRNDDHPTFAEALDEVVSRLGAVDAIALAVAGPVNGGRVRMTNRDWVVEETYLATRTSGPVRMMNDLTAQVLAVPDLRETDREVLRAGKTVPGGQWLVVNCGTGFNAAPGLHHGKGCAALTTEVGMCVLPARIADRLRASNYPVPATCDELLSGRGLSGMRHVLGEGADTLFAHCLADMLRDQIYAMMPQGGVYLCGGVARAVVEGPARDVVLARLTEAYDPYPFLKDLPVSLITADDAALIGCQAALR
mgnify:CR=1 FL=1